MRRGRRSARHWRPSRITRARPPKAGEGVWRSSPWAGAMRRICEPPRRCGAGVSRRTSREKPFPARVLSGGGLWYGACDTGCMLPRWTSSQSGMCIRRPGRVLVVDDDRLLADALQRDLSDENEVVIESEAAKALAQLERGEFYDVLLCELMMPAMDGIDLHRRLCASHRDVADRIVFMTGEATTARIDAFFRR